MTGSPSAKAPGTPGPDGAGVAVRTVLGDVPPGQLGVCDFHDHLFFASAQLPGQELDNVEAAAAELTAFRELGGHAVVQWTPYGLGRRADLLGVAAQLSGVTVVAATGLHQLAHYRDQAVPRAATGGGPGLPYLLRVLRPRLEAELGHEVTDKFFVTNPARAFARWRR